MKLYLYLGRVRDRRNLYSAASYETIFDRIKISELDIRKAIARLIATGLLRNVNRQQNDEHDEAKANYGPNTYSLKGCEHFFPQSRTTAT